MLRRIVQQDKSVFCLKLREDLFTVMQMRDKWFLEFFDVKSNTAEFHGLDLNIVGSLFCLIAAEKRFTPLVVKKLNPKNLIPNARPIPKRMLSAIIGLNNQYGANLIELDEKYSTDHELVIQPHLTIERDLDIIYRYELTGMVGDPEKIRKRLLLYFDTGVNWDESKAFLFKGILPPPPSYQASKWVYQ